SRSTRLSPRSSTGRRRREWRGGQPRRRCRGNDGDRWAQPRWQLPSPPHGLNLCHGVSYPSSREPTVFPPGRRYERGISFNYDVIAGAKEKMASERSEPVIRDHLEGLSPLDLLAPSNDEEVDVLCVGQPLEQFMETLTVHRGGVLHCLPVKSVDHHQRW